MGCFLCLVLVQLFVPAWMIAQREWTLRHGHQFRFRTDPISPRDTFDRRSVRLYIPNSVSDCPPGMQLFRHQKVYVLLEEDDQGFALIDGLSLDRPNGDAYLKAKVDYLKGNQVHLDLPFNRYYLEEKPLPAVTESYQKHDRKGPQEAYVAVRVKSGYAVLEELYIGGKPIAEYLQSVK